MDAPFTSMSTTVALASRSSRSVRLPSEAAFQSGETIVDEEGWAMAGRREAARRQATVDKMTAARNRT